MALSDCIHWWETPCVCGHEYKRWTFERLSTHMAMLQGILAEKQPLYFQGEEVGKLSDSTLGDVVKAVRLAIDPIASHSMWDVVFDAEAHLGNEARRAARDRPYCERVLVEYVQRGTGG